MWPHLSCAIRPRVRRKVHEAKIIHTSANPKPQRVSQIESNPIDMLLPTTVGLGRDLVVDECVSYVRD